MKRCSKCKNIKSIEKFPKDRNRSDGHDHRCKQCKNPQTAAWKRKNPKAQILHNYNFRKRNPGIGTYQVTKCVLAYCTPPGTDMAKIRQFYLNRPDNMTVDHIVPLKGKGVCGLHVPYNLQYLTLSENCSKGIKY